MERPFTDSYLNSYSHEHLFYEIDMLFGLVATLTEPARRVIAPSVNDARRVTNALIEAFGLHLRNLIDFIYIDFPQRTDVVANDFCASGTWLTVRPPISKTLETARVRANKEFAHLTTARIFGVSPEKGWEFLLLANEIKALITLFIGQARTSALAPSVVQVIHDN